MDNDPLILRIIDMNLGHRDYTLIETGNVEEAFNLLRTRTVDLVLLSQTLTLDSYALCESIRALTDVPIIMMANQTEASDRRQAFESGVSGFLEKPFSAEELVNAIRTALSAG